MTDNPPKIERMVREPNMARSAEERFVMGYVGGKPLHVVAACDETNRRAFVITAYEPSLDVFESDYRTKKIV